MLSLLHLRVDSGGQNTLNWNTLLPAAPQASGLNCVQLLLIS